MSFVDGAVRVSVPATSANLGPGFDTLGLALGLRDQLEAEVLPHGLVIDVEGAGADTVTLDERHLVISSMRAAFEALGCRPPGLRLSCVNVVPHARGLGSSSAAIVGGLALARALVDDGDQRLDDDVLFALAARLEGHPDNVAPACYGGFVVAGQDSASGDFYAVRCALDPRLRAMAMVPPTGLETSVARGLLPAVVPHAEAAANAGRAALLVAALGGHVDQLFRATADSLHQDYRAPAMPESLDLLHRLRRLGVPAIVSGAGPTVLAFTDDLTWPGGDALRSQVPDGWTWLELSLDPDGVRLE